LCEEFAFCDGNFIPVVCYGRQRARLWTFAGSAVNGPLSQALVKRGLGVDTFDNFSVTLAREAIKRLSDTLYHLNMFELYPTISQAFDRAMKFATCLPQGEVEAILSERLRDEIGLRETVVRPVREIIITK